MDIALNKSQYVLGRQCPKWLWLDAHEEKPEGLEKKLISAHSELLRIGTDTGVLARQYFDGGVLIDEEDFDKAVTDTSASDADILYEAAIEVDGLRLRADIIRRNGDVWDLIEVKSSASVKPVHLIDVAFQKYVLEKAGYTIGDCYVMHINTKYKRDGDIDVEGLFSLTQVNDDLEEELSVVEEHIADFMAMLGQKEAPEKHVGPHCSKPYSCVKKSTCWSDIPKHSIYERSLYFKEEELVELRKRGVTEAKNISRELEKKLFGNRRSSNPQMYLRALHRGEIFVDQRRVRDFLAQIEYPINHLDFETINPGTPPFPGLRPFQIVPFQYSLHIEYKRGALEHREFLASDDADPRRPLLERLLEDIPRHGSIVSYNAAFEKDVIRDLAKTTRKYGADLRALLPRFVDLFAPFKFRDVNHPEFRGSASLKAITPVLVPDLSYDELEIGHGNDTSFAFLELVRNGRNELREPMLAYCRQDTLAQVEILKVLRKAVKPKKRRS